MNIFLLEDDSAIGIALTYSLENEGYKVTLAKSVANANEIIENESFSLYILDLTLPDGSGYDVCIVVYDITSYNKNQNGFGRCVS